MMANNIGLETAFMRHLSAQGTINITGCSHALNNLTPLTQNGKPLHSKPFRHVKPLVEYRPHIFLQIEVLEEWKQDLQKLHKPHERWEIKPRYVVSMQDVIIRFFLWIDKPNYLVIVWLSSRERKAWYSIQWLQQKTKWVVINNNNSAEIFG